MAEHSLQVYPDTKIYICCPDQLVTGGPEALHQLRWYLERLGYSAYLVYSTSEHTACPPRYEKYAPKVVSWRDIEDDARNILIAVESETTFLRYFHNLRPCIWFLSFGYADLKKSRALIVCKNIIKFFIRVLTLGKKKFVYNRFPVFRRSGILYLCGSKYAYEELKKRRVEQVEMLVEPISLEFLQRGPAKNLTAEGREDTVLYNPAKPSRIMKKLLRRKDIVFRPLRGYSPEQLIDLYRHSKLYVDFGEFGGPERIPKESVYNGTCLLVGKRNAAVNDFDVAIPEAYKIKKFNDEEIVAAAIKELLASYDAKIGEFAPFRAKIDGLEEEFMRKIEQIFVRVRTE